MILVVFHIAGINEKKKEKKKNFLFGTEPGWATAQFNLGLGSGALGRASVGAGALG